MSNAHELIAGVHGYSGPCDELVVFEIHPFCTTWADGAPARLIENNAGAAPTVACGCWQGKESDAFILPLAAFRELQRRAPAILSAEDCVLILGRPEARNWRPARLEWLRGDKAGTAEAIGTWHSVTEAEARSRDGWTYVPSLSAWFVVSVDPAPSVSARDLASVPRDPVPDFPTEGGPAMPHDYSRDPGGAALHMESARVDYRRAGMCELQGDLASALWWHKRAAQHLGLAYDAAQHWARAELHDARVWQRQADLWHDEARDATAELHKARAELHDVRQRATMWELIAKASACTIGRRDMIRPSLEQEAITWAEASAALQWIMDARKAGGAA